jgi:nicotinamide-nucleotide amidase
MQDDEGLIEEAQRLIAEATAAGLRVVTAESCTGGLVAAYLTEVPGSSAVVERGYVTYSNAAKTEVLQVDDAALQAFGAVSGEVARAMALGALAASHADIAVSVTGVAGPGGGSAEKPVGLVHFAAARGDRLVHRKEMFGDIGRRRIRLMSVAIAFDLIDQMMRQE